MFDENLAIFRAITKYCHFRAKKTRRHNDDGDVAIAWNDASSNQYGKERNDKRIVESHATRHMCTYLLALYFPQHGKRVTGRLGRNAAVISAQHYAAFP
jgi:hypothetical protein